MSVSTQLPPPMAPFFPPSPSRLRHSLHQTALWENALVRLKVVCAFVFHFSPAVEVIQNASDIVLRLHCNTAGATAALKIN